MSNTGVLIIIVWELPSWTVAHKLQKPSHKCLWGLPQKQNISEGSRLQSTFFPSTAKKGARQIWTYGGQGPGPQTPRFEASLDRALAIQVFILIVVVAWISGLLVAAPNLD